MDQVRCPMCGKDNPADLVICRYCQARLRPIWEGGTQSSGNFSVGEPDLPDWLKALGSAEDDPTLAPSVGEANRFDDSAESSTDQEDFGVDSGDWLSRIGAATENDPLKPFSAEPDIEHLEEYTEEQLPQVGDAPNWLQQTETEQPEWISGQPSTAPFDLDREEANLPNWLKGSDLADEAVSTEDPFDESEPKRVDSDLPDWLSGLDPELQPVSEPIAQSEQPTELPDWLGGLTAASQQSDLEAAAPGMAESEADALAGLPEWLSNLEPAVSPEALPEPKIVGPAEPEESFAADTELGFASVVSKEEELSELEIHEGDDALSFLDEGPVELEILEASTAVSVSEGGDTLEDGMSAWLSALEAEDTTSGNVILESVETLPESDLSWLSDLEATQRGLNLEADEASNALGVEDAFGDTSPAPIDLPAWLMAEAAKADELESPAGTEEDLGTNELPSWLQAMRPIAAVGFLGETSAEGSVEHVEGAGPLAGLRGILPAEPDITRIEKTAADVVRLQVSDQQEMQVKLLAGLIEAEALSPPAAERATAATGTTLRLAVALLLVLGLLAAILIGKPVYDFPLPSPEVMSVVRVVESLPPGAPVLVAVDYEPGFSPELDPLTRSVLVHLVQRGVVPVLVSSTSTGPMQIQRLLDSIAVGDSQSAAARRMYINLGYIPGGVLGLANFSTAPRSAIPFDSRGGSAWDAAELQSVDSLDDFALAVVATESLERARSWIEQARPRLGDRPLIMLTSAQAEPLVRPYYDTVPSQVTALVSGLGGAVAYEINTGQVAAANRSWSPFNFGLVLSATLMLLGAMLSVMGTRLSGRREKQTPKDESGRDE